MFSRTDPSETIVKSYLRWKNRVGTIVKTRFFPRKYDFTMVSGGSVRENIVFYVVS